MPLISNLISGIASNLNLELLYKLFIIDLQKVLIL